MVKGILLFVVFLVLLILYAISFDHPSLIHDGMLSICSQKGSVVDQAFFFQHARQGHIAEMKALITKFRVCNVNIQDRMQQTPLMVAVQNKHYDIVEWLLTRYNANTMVESKLGRTALMMAVSNLDLEMIQLLIEKGNVNVNQKNRYGMTALESLAYVKGNLEKSVEIVEYLVDINGANINHIDYMRHTLLSRSVAATNLDLIKYLIEEQHASIKLPRSRDILKIAKTRKKRTKGRFGTDAVFEYLSQKFKTIPLS